jgi:Flp pilus assembly protein CpaB
MTSSAVLDRAGGGAPFRVTHRRILPTGRAVVGGLLVTASAVGLFAAYGSAGDGPHDRYVTLAHDVVAGHVLSSADLRVVAIDLPAAQRSVSFTDARRLVGTVAVTRLKQGQLVQSADVSPRSARGERADVSVAVEPGSAMNGRSEYLRGGERVDVIATFLDGGLPVTRTVARDVIVVDVLTADRSLGNNGKLTVVLSVLPKDLEAVAGASAAGKLTLARTTGLRR